MRASEQLSASAITLAILVTSACGSSSAVHTGQPAQIRFGIGFTHGGLDTDHAHAVMPQRSTYALQSSTFAKYDGSMAFATSLHQPVGSRTVTIVFTLIEGQAGSYNFYRQKITGPSASSRSIADSVPWPTLERLGVGLQGTYRLSLYRGHTLLAQGRFKTCHAITGGAADLNLPITPRKCLLLVPAGLKVHMSAAGPRCQANCAPDHGDTPFCRSGGPLSDCHMSSTFTTAGKWRLYYRFSCPNVNNLNDGFSVLVYDGSKVTRGGIFFIGNIRGQGKQVKRSSGVHHFVVSSVCNWQIWAS